MVMLNGHYNGKTVILDDPHSLRSGTRVKVIVENSESTVTAEKPPVFQPLDIRIAGELANAIALDPEFGIEES